MADRITFTRSSAQRISDAVRAVEQGNRDSVGFVPSPRLQGGKDFKLRLGTFTGSWSTGTYKVVEIHGTTETVSVYNWCNPAFGDTANSTEGKYVIFGNVHGTQSAVEIQIGSTSETCSMTIGSTDLSELPGFSAGDIQLLGHNSNIDVNDTNSTVCVTLQWYSVFTCTTATAT